MAIKYSPTVRVLATPPRRAPRFYLHHGPSHAPPGGHGVPYSWRHWLPRWEVGGAGTGGLMTYRLA